MASLNQTIIMISDDEDMDVQIVGYKAGTGRVVNSRVGNRRNNSHRANINRVGANQVCNNVAGGGQAGNSRADVSPVATLRDATNRVDITRAAIKPAAVGPIVKGRVRKSRTVNKQVVKRRTATSRAAAADLDTTFVVNVRPTTNLACTTRSVVRRAASNQLYIDVDQLFSVKCWIDMVFGNNTKTLDGCQSST